MIHHLNAQLLESEKNKSYIILRVAMAPQMNNLYFYQNFSGASILSWVNWLKNCEFSKFELLKESTLLNESNLFSNTPNWWLITIEPVDIGKKTSEEKSK